MAAAWSSLSPCCPAPWVGRSAHVLGMAVVVMSHAEQDTADNEASLLRQLQEQWLFYHQQHPGREGWSHFLPIVIVTVPSWLLAQFPQQGENLGSVCGGYPQGYCHTASSTYSHVSAPCCSWGHRTQADTPLIWTVLGIIFLENC